MEEKLIKVYPRPYTNIWYYSDLYGRAFGQVHNEDSALGWESVDRVQFFPYSSPVPELEVGACSPRYVLTMCLFSSSLSYSQTIKTFLQNRRNTWKRPSNLPPMQMWRRTASAYLPLVQSRWEYTQACDRTTQYVTTGLLYCVQDLEFHSTSCFKHCVPQSVVKTYPPLLTVSVTKLDFYLFRSADSCHKHRVFFCICFNKNCVVW